MACQVQSQAEQMGYDFTNGVAKKIDESLKDPENVQAIGILASQITDQVVKNTFSGAGNSFKKDGEVDKLTKEVGGALNRNTKNIMEEFENSSEHVVEHAGNAFGNLANEFGDKVEVGGELDIAIKKLFAMGMANSQMVWNNFIYPNMLIFSGIGLSTLAGYYAIPIMAKYLERELLNPRPKLIIESSKKTYYQMLTSFWTSKLPLEMVFSQGLKEQLDDIAKVTTMINKKIGQGKTNVKYRNLMLYGPPGTGKTMFAKELAKKSGLQYAFMSGSSFSKFKDGEGIQALDELFAWAKNSKGLMIFIDEAETFLSKRENMDPQSKAYQLLNNFLNYTGERSSQFMIVFATNHKDALDSAMYRRIDDLIEMPLPSLDQRLSALKLYRNKILLDAKNNDKDFIDSVHKNFNDHNIKIVAEKTKGLSYGDLEGIINAMKTDADILEPAVLNHKLINKVVDRAVKKHDAFTNGQLLGTVED